jgi:hypothetical protein
MGERKRVERFEDLIGSVERVVMTRATRAKGLRSIESRSLNFSQLLRPGDWETPRSEGPALRLCRTFGAPLIPALRLLSVGSGLAAKIRHRNCEQQH